MDSLPAELISVLEADVIQNYIQIAAAALLIYEQLISLGEEVAYMWSLRHPSLLFLLNRLNTLVMCACFILRPFSPENILSCRAYESLGNLFSLACLLLWSSLSSLRVYAVSNRNLWVTIVNAVLGLVPFCVNLYGMTQESLQLWNLDSFNLCYAVSTSVTATIFNRRSVLARSCAIASDAMTVAVIWYFIPGGFKHCRTDSAKNSLPSYLWRNGTIHFIVLLFLNLADMVLDVMKILFPEAGSSIEVYSPLPLLIFPITSIIISRFTLQLCKLYVTAQNAEQSLIVPTHSEEPTTTVPSMGPYTSITPWNMECFAADPDTPAQLGSVLGFPEDIEAKDRKNSGDVVVVRFSAHEDTDPWG